MFSFAIQKRLSSGAEAEDLVHVPVVGSAAATENGDVSQFVQKPAVVAGELLWVARVQLFGLIEFLMAPARGVGPNCHDPMHPVLSRIQYRLEV